MGSYREARSASSAEVRPHTAPASKRPGVLLGVGLGGFVDGILLHQIAQWHSMGSARVPPVTMAAMRQNMRWDGFFHAAVWAVTLAGVFLLLRDAHRGARLPTARTLAAQMLAGWGGFNLVEGVIDHHLLQLHHVRDLPVHVPAYDWTFLAVGGIGFLIVGWWGARSERERDARAV
jgi:uncharacterized membrane protein